MTALLGKMGETVGEMERVLTQAQEEQGGSYFDGHHGSAGNQSPGLGMGMGPRRAQSFGLRGRKEARDAVAVANGMAGEGQTPNGKDREKEREGKEKKGFGLFHRKCASVYADIHAGCVLMRVVRSFAPQRPDADLALPLGVGRADPLLPSHQLPSAVSHAVALLFRCYKHDAHAARALACSG
jgi:hypothetical protein